MEALSVHSIPTPLGDMYAAFSENGICYLGFHDQQKNPLHKFIRKNGLMANSEASRFLENTTNDLHAFFIGLQSLPTSPLDLRGTDFQKAVWRSLIEIPFGTRRTYAQQAATLGDLSAIRAVAAANGANPISILIPCHRVVGTDGSLTGYASGVHRKKALLNIEAKSSGQAVQLGMFD